MFVCLMLFVWFGCLFLLFGLVDYLLGGVGFSGGFGFGFVGWVVC